MHPKLCASTHVCAPDTPFHCQDGSLLTLPRLQALLHKALRPLKLPVELFGCALSATATEEIGIPLDIIKAIGRIFQIGLHSIHIDQASPARCIPNP